MKKLLLTLTCIISTSCAEVNLDPTASFDTTAFFNEFMQKHFQRATTDQDLIEARNKQGYTVLEVLRDETAQVSNPYELLKLICILDKIKPDIQDKMIDIMVKEQRNNEDPIKVLLEKYESDEEKRNIILSNLALFGLAQYNIFLEKEKDILKRENIQLQQHNNNLFKKNMKLEQEIDYLKSQRFYTIIGVGSLIILGIIINGVKTS